MGLMAAELLRRTERFSEAEARLTELEPNLATGSVFPDLAKYQRELIGRRDSAPHELPRSERKK
ncbi:hypothetical protein ACFSM5_14540 [Lacibacterium aquatile]|uniref:Tetratricopeptide repeat protein n=1 Tax=Lacibacterium aquatile TaxID=1168082 RepID=A0ABW5DUG5_9PROT